MDKELKLKLVKLAQYALGLLAVAIYGYLKSHGVVIPAWVGDLLSGGAGALLVPRLTELVGESQGG